MSDRHVLVLELDEEMLERTLFLAEPATGDLIQLAWDDQGRPDQNVLRWEEVEAVCRCLAARDPALHHPGIPLLLLKPFAPVTAADDEAAIRQLVARAWQATGLFSEHEIAELVAETCFTWEERELQWVWNAQLGAWTAEGEFPQSLRHVENDEFPFALLEELFEQARRSCRAD